MDTFELQCRAAEYYEDLINEALKVKNYVGAKSYLSLLSNHSPFKAQELAHVIAKQAASI